MSLKPHYRPTDLQVLRLLGWHETFRRLGFEPGEMYAALEQGEVVFLLDAQGKTFTASCGMWEATKPFDEEWKRAVEWWNVTATDAELSKLYQVFQLDAPPAPKIVQILLERGFKLRPYPLPIPYVNA